MSFSSSLGGVIATVSATFIAALAVSAGASSASADAIPGPPLASASTFAVAPQELPAGAFCSLRTSAPGDAAGFAAGVLLVAIAARRRVPR